MYQQIPDKYDINTQEVSNTRRIPCNPDYPNTSHRPYTSPVNNRHTIHRIPVASERRVNYPDVYGQYGKFSYSTFQPITINTHIPSSFYPQYNSPQVNPNLSQIPKDSHIFIGQGEPRIHYSDPNKSHHQESTIKSSNQKRLKYESIIEWFDRTAEAELQKRRISFVNTGENLESFSTQPNPVRYQVSTAGIDIERKLQFGQDTELLDAVDKLAKAEALIVFEGAIKAAEEAAANAPPELAEEAAAAGAKSFQAEVTGLVKQEIPGVKPIEVIGYVGITRPKKPRKSNFVN